MPLPVGTSILIDGEAAGAEGWPGANGGKQRRNLVHFVVVFNKLHSSRSVAVFLERRSAVDDELTEDCVQFAGPRWTVAEHITRLADPRRGESVVIATNHPQLFRGQQTITIGDLLDHFIAS